MRLLTWLTATALFLSFSAAPALSAPDDGTGHGHNGCVDGHGGGCGHGGGHGHGDFTFNSTFTPGWAFPHYFDTRINYPYPCPYPSPLVSPYHPLPSAPVAALPVIPIPGPKPGPGPGPKPNPQPNPNPQPKAPKGEVRPQPQAPEATGVILISEYRAW